MAVQRTKAAKSSGNSKSSKRIKTAQNPQPTLAPPSNLADCLCGCLTFHEYIAKLSTRVDVAWRAEYADRVWGKGEELAALVNALPEA